MREEEDRRWKQVEAMHGAQTMVIFRSYLFFFFFKKKGLEKKREKIFSFF